MTDVSFIQDQYTIQHKRPRDGITHPYTLRVFNYAPRRIALQLRDAKGYSTATLTIDQVDALIDTLLEARNETFPPIEPRK